MNVIIGATDTFRDAAGGANCTSEKCMEPITPFINDKTFAMFRAKDDMDVEVQASRRHNLSRTPSGCAFHLLIDTVGFHPRLISIVPSGRDIGGLMRNFIHG